MTVGLANGAGHLSGNILRSFGDLLMLDDCHNCAADFLKTLSVGRFAIQHFDNMETVLRFYQIRNRTLRGAESSLLEFRHRLLFNYPAEITALGFRRVTF